MITCLLAVLIAGLLGDLLAVFAGLIEFPGLLIGEVEILFCGCEFGAGLFVCSELFISGGRVAFIVLKDTGVER